MAKIDDIRRAFLGEGSSISEISRKQSADRKTIRKYLAKETIAAVDKYIYDCNTICQHASLGGLPPDAFARQQKTHAA